MRYFVAIIVAMAAMFPLATTAHAQSPGPTLTANEATCYQNLVETGDLYCQLRYELPTFTTVPPPPATPEAWCAELVDQDGCITDPVEPTNETSLITDAAFVTLYQNCGVDCSTGTLENQVRVPRINHALGGAYLSAGHAITFGDTTVNQCVESSASLFSPRSQSCIAVVWNIAPSDTASQRAQYGTDLVAQLRNIETNRNLALNSYVSNNLITSGGRILAIEGLSVSDQIAPTRFQAASESSADEAFTTPDGTPLALQASIDANAAVTDIPGAFDSLGSIVFGISGGAMGTLFFLLLGLIFFGWLQVQTKNFVLPTAGLVTVAMTGLFVRSPTVSVLSVAALAFGLVGAMFILRKVST